MDDQLTLGTIWIFLYRRRAVVLLTMLGWLTLAVLVCVFLPRKYEATGEIQVAKQSSDGLGLDKLNTENDTASDALDANISLQTQAEILKSDTLALRVIEGLQLESTPDFQYHFNPVAWLMGKLSVSAPSDPKNASLEDSPRRRAHVIAVFTKALKIKPIAGTRLITISYISSDRKTAANVVNLLTRELIDYAFQTRNGATDQASAWLSGQLADVKKQAEEMQAKVVQLQRDAGVYDLGIVDANGKDVAYSATLDRLQQATNALSQATSNRILKGAIARLVETGNPEMISGLSGASLSSSSAAVNNSFNLIQSLRSQQATLEVQVAGDTSKYGSANPKLSDDKMALASIDGAIAAELGRIRGRAESDYEGAQAAENDMHTLYDRERSAADKLNDKAIEYSIAKQEATQSRELYETLFQHLKEAGVTEGLRSSNVSVVDPGRTPAKPVRPNPPLYLAVSLVLGLMFGAITALLVEATDDRLQSIDQVGKRLALPIAGLLPMVSREPRAPSPTNLLGGGGPGTATQGLRLPALDGSATAFSEALRSLRTSLLHSPTDAPPKFILVTSPAEGEGKTTVAVHLAAVLSQNGSKVLLVEADMRRPGLSQRFRLNTSAGLSSLLGGEAPHTTEHPFAALPNLHILPSGPTPPFPSELLGSKRMLDLKQQWAREYDFVLFDSPPALVVTDARVLSRLADATLLVARYSQTTKSSVQRAAQLLHDGKRDSHLSVLVNGVSNQAAPWIYNYSQYIDQNDASHAHES